MIFLPSKYLNFNN